MKRSAGLLLYRLNQEKDFEFFLVHPGGPFFAKKDDGFWTIPKGEIDAGEDPLQTAKREFVEETGFLPAGTFIPLGEIKQKAGKVVEAWAVKGDFDVAKLVSNTFEIEWPPKSGKMKAFPEIDKAGWFGYEEAKRKMNEAQSAFLIRLAEQIQ